MFKWMLRQWLRYWAFRHLSKAIERANMGANYLAFLGEATAARRADEAYTLLRAARAAVRN